jgi:hypothetical protein|nr:MAG TPA: hypothetical protein [Caudoviricetes sp.]
METKEFKIQVPEGYEIDKEKSTFEKIVFKKVEKELPKSWRDLEEISGFYIDKYSKVSSSYIYNTDEENKNVFPTEKEAKASVALAQLCQLRDRYNDGWKPDWMNSAEKYIIYFYRNAICCDTAYTLHKVLAFKTKELRDKFLENFRDLIEIAKPLL